MKGAAFDRENNKPLADVIDDAIDWDFVEVFPGDPDDPGYASPAAFAQHIAKVVLNHLEAVSHD